MWISEWRALEAENVQMQKNMKLDNQAVPSAQEISVEYLYAYLKSKETTMEYIKRKEAAETFHQSGTIWIQP